MRGHSGFTLIELLVVIAIMGIMALVALPSVGTGYSSRLDTVEMEVRDALSRASSLARSTRETHGVVFDVSTDRFAVVDSHGTAVSDPLTHGAYVVSFNRPDQPRGIDFTRVDFGANGAAAIFDGQGLPVLAGTIKFQCKTSVRTLTLDAATGKVASS